MCTLLNNPKILDYPYKRKNLDEAILTFDKNNNYTVTLPKFLKDKRKKQNHLIYENKSKDLKAVTKLYKSVDYSKNKRYIEESKKLNDNLLLSEKEQNILFENLRTKYFPKQNDISNQSITNPFLTENSLLKKPKFLTPIQKEKLAFLNELTLFNDVQKIKVKTKILKDIKERENKKKFKLLPIDLFHYDKVRWAKQTEDRSIFEKEEKANLIEKETKQKLVKMKNDVVKVQKNAKESAQIVEETLNEINKRQNTNNPKKVKSSKGLNFNPSNNLSNTLEKIKNENPKDSGNLLIEDNNTHNENKYEIKEKNENEDIENKSEKEKKEKIKEDKLSYVKNDKKRNIHEEDMKEKEEPIKDEKEIEKENIEENKIEKENIEEKEKKEENTEENENQSNMSEEQ